ncbi:MAG: branched-chain amino acid ABC transporter permease [Dehalococcoidia bacterium]|nr:branched-chain amino acid ABC transporter permease [Dehalococcoidia bacterium]
MRRSFLPIILVIAGLAILAILPKVLTSYYVGLLVTVLIFGIFALSLDLLLGHCGLPSLGHAASFGTAAYVAGFLSLKIANNAPVNFAAALFAGGAVAAIFGLLALRTRGIYFLMITLALSQVLWGLAFKWKSATGGDDGMPGIPRPNLSMLGLDLTPVNSYYYFTLALFVLVCILMYILIRSPFGHSLRGIRESESRMLALGYNVWAHQYVAFIIAGLFAALAGILYVYYNNMVSPKDLHLITSAKVLLMVILGGTGTFLGPILGATLIVLLENIVSGFTERWLLILGIIYVLVIMLAPKGLLGPLRGRLRRWIPM